jgi:ATP-dependent helicase HrpB
MQAPLPIDAVIPDLLAALSGAGRAVLQAPPGAGKTTRVPLALLQDGHIKGRILMLEPRRLATRAAAERLAEQLGETAGATVGYRMRGDSRTSPQTRIEVVTEGILTRMIQSDPELTGIGAVIFDEFHERSLHADLGLALVGEIRAALRPDLTLLVMSATLDAAPVAALLDDAPIITSEGRSFPVEIRHRDAQWPKTARIEAVTADAVHEALAAEEGNILVFLPGEGEIRRTQARLDGTLPADVALAPLYGALPFAKQRAAIAPPAAGRKVVLATSIAETSLTIEGIRVVIDAGRARRARFDPGSGMSRLVTERVTRAEADQRAGRAGRLTPGVAYRLWTKGEEGALAAFPPAEIESADLAPLALELALWGSADLPFLTPPPAGALAEAQTLLTALGALDDQGRITAHGRAIAALPLHPRLAHMALIAGRPAAPLAALLAERDPLSGAPSDITLRLKAITARYDGPGTANPATLDRIRTEAKRLARDLPDRPARAAGDMLSLAYPDRIGLRRKGDAPRFVLSGGKGAVLPDDDPLAGQRLIVACDLDGDRREARIRLCAPLTDSALRAQFGNRIAWQDHCAWSRRERRVMARQQEVFGALVLDDRNWPDAPPEALSRAMCDGIRELGLRLSPAAERFRARIALIRQEAPDALPPVDDAHLLDTLEDWLAPYLTGVTTAEDWKRFDALDALRARLTWDQMQMLDAAAPAHFETPLGRRIPIDYASDPPEITLRLQEMFGVTRHPTVGGTALKVTLLSPGQKPVQTTTDIPGFWRSSYADVRKDMRGRYPKHPWPEDPTVADPTLRAKPRKD